MYKKKETRETEIGFYESLLKRMPTDIDALKLLAEAYTSSGRIKDGLALDYKLRSLCPKDGVVCYNLACSLALCGRLDDAFPALKQAIQLGYSDLEWMEKDPDLEKLRKDARYAGEILPLLSKK